jgi:peptidoglycan/xylan/chitin deacetylase (PgdA/CDA1 family)
MLENKSLISGRNVLITFDDGFKSNKFIADKYLNPLEIKSIFFVVSDFINQTSISEAKKFVSNFILPGSSIESMDDTMVNMSWEDLSSLSKEGHVIGAHTKTHKKLSEVSTKKQMITEVLESANSIEKKININVTNFAYTFGDISSFSLAALKCAATKFSHVYTGLRGNNVNEASLLSIRRDAVCPTDPPLLLGYCLEGGFDFIYKKKLEVYRSWVSTLNI